MRTLIRLFKLIQAKSQYRILLLPAAFFMLELIVAMVLNWQLFGEQYEFNDSPGIQQASIHNPLIVIKAVHSDRLTLPFGSEFSEETPLVHFYNKKSMVKALSFMASLMFAYIGIFISILWIKRYLRNNTHTINWWQWPIACIGAHVFLYLFANSNLVSNIF